MKLTIDRSNFLKVLNTVNIAIGQKSPTPAYLNFKITMESDKLSVLGSNNEMTICSILPIEKEGKKLIYDFEEGSTLIAAKYLLEIIRRLDSEVVTIEIIDEVIVKISDQKSEFKLNSMRAEEYPDIDLEIPSQAVEFTGEEFKKFISQTSFAASTKDARPILTAINFKSDGKTVGFIATDAYRLAIKTVAKNTAPFEANIPVKALQEVSKLVENDNVTLSISTNKVVFQYNGTTIYSRLINGIFPTVTRMIPVKFDYVLKVNANTFINAMQRVSLLAIERENIVKLTLSNEMIEISSKSDQIGSANERIDVFEYQGDRMEISYNVNYVIDAIKAVMSEDVILSFCGEMSAFKVTSAVDDSIIQVVTPVRSYY